MKSSSKLFGAVVAAALITGTLAGPASAQSNNNTGPRTGLFGALLGPVGAAAAVGTTTTVFSWTSVMTSQWVYQWNTLNLFSPNGLAAKTVHAGLKYAHVKLDPTYFNEAWHKQVFSHSSGQHTISADKKVQHTSKSKSTKNMGKAVVGCIFGSALGAITASIRKASAMGNPPRWRSHAEHERIAASGVEKMYELTNDEAHTAVALCGAGSLTLHWPQNAI